MVATSPLGATTVTYRRKLWPPIVCVMTEAMYRRKMYVISADVCRNGAAHLIVMAD